MSNSVDATSYTRQLRAGAFALRFEAPLEQEFRRASVQARVPVLRTNLFIGLGLVVALGLLELGLLEGRAMVAAAGLRFGVMVPALLVALAASYGRWTRHLAALLTTVAFVFALGTLGGFALGADAVDPALEAVVVVLYIYLLLGLRLVPALAVAVPLAIGASAIEIAARGGIDAAVIRDLLLIGTGSLVAALVCFRLERAARKSFLENEVLNLLVGRDALTGIPNRRAFDSHLHSVIRHAQRETRGLAVILIELDHFEEFRILYGEQQADACLRRIAHSVMSCARRPLDYAARFSAVRFALALYDPAPEFVEQLVAKIRSNVALLDVPHEASPAGCAVTVSIGVGAASRNDVCTEVLPTALAALEAAVADGRNRFVIGSALDTAARARVVRGPWAPPSAND